MTKHSINRRLRRFHVVVGQRNAGKRDACAEPEGLLIKTIAF